MTDTAQAGSGYVYRRSPNTTLQGDDRRSIGTVYKYTNEDNMLSFR